MNSITLNDFRPINTWKPDVDGPKWVMGSKSDPKEPKYLIDQSTGRKYWNEYKGIVRVHLGPRLSMPLPPSSTWRIAFSNL
jgi:hypothetical protein